MLNTFNIGDTMFQFGTGHELYWNNQGAWHLVTTWQQPGLDLDPFDRELGTDFNSALFSEGLQSMQPFGFPYDFSQFNHSSVTSGLFPEATQSQDQTKKESEELLKPNPLNSSLQGSMPWSPSSSTQSPIVSSTSRATSESFEQPLISSSLKTEWPLFSGQLDLGYEQKFGEIAGLQLWKHETREIQSARHSPGVDKMDRRRCPECSKVFRRPSSLEVCMHFNLLINSADDMFYVGPPQRSLW